MSLSRIIIATGYTLMSVILIGLPVLYSAGVRPAPEIRGWALSVGVCSAVIASALVARGCRDRRPVTTKQLRQMRSALAEEMREISEDQAQQILASLRNELRLSELRGEDHDRANVRHLRPQ